MIAMKRLLLTILLFTVRCLAGDSWPDVKFTEVRAYAWPDDTSTRAVVLEGMKLKPGAVNPEGALLTVEQTRSLLASVTGKRSGYSTFACHIPHNAFLFYDESKKPVAFVEICFGCFNHRSSPQGSAAWLDLVSLAAIFDAHKLPMGEYADLAAFKARYDERERVRKEFEEEQRSSRGKP
jgi:hypothetical protein